MGSRLCREIDLIQIEVIVEPKPKLILYAIFEYNKNK